jgi:type VI secretion system ImpA family protein
MRFEPLYDAIREARRDEDPNLSQGVWQTDVKRADWHLVENLCTHALATQTKDLQIAAWLTEAWLALEGMAGFVRGIDLLTQLCNAFWDSIHPKPEQDDSDTRNFVFEWMDEEMNRRLMLVALAQTPIDQGEAQFTLAQWMAAIHLDRVAKRTADPRKAISSATARGGVTLENFRQALTLTTYDFMNTLAGHVRAAKEGIEELRHFVGERTPPDNAPNLTNIRRTLEDIERIVKTALASKSPPSAHATQKALHHESVGDVEGILTPPQAQPTEPAPTNGDGPKIIAQRQDAYQAIRELGHFLLALDPHSPVPQLLSLIGAWENMSLGEILTDIANGLPQSHMLLRLLASASDANSNVTLASVPPPAMSGGPQMNGGTQPFMPPMRGGSSS